MDRHRHDPFAQAQLPERMTREGRVRLLAECFSALLDNRMPSREAALFVAGGGLQWLEQGGDLVRDYWKVSARAGSHHTPSHLWRALSLETPSSSSRGAQRGAESANLESPSSTQRGDST